MFEIGNSLREARVRQGLDFGHVEADIKIRGKYLRALEEERFDVLPGETYVKGFLRTYADYLGLDGQLYVDEFNSRFATNEEPQIAPGRSGARRSRNVESNVVVVALAAIVAVTLLVVVAWRIGSPGANERASLPNPPPETVQAGSRTETTEARVARKAKPRARGVRLVLAAARGDCWLEVKRRGPTGELVYSGTLEQGQRQRFAGRRLWIRVGRPSALDATLNGKRVTLPQLQAILVVTARGVRTVSQL